MQNFKVKDLMIYLKQGNNTNSENVFSPGHIVGEDCAMPSHCSVSSPCMMPSHCPASTTDPCAMPSHCSVSSPDPCVMPSHCPASSPDPCAMPSHCRASKPDNYFDNDVIGEQSHTKDLLLSDIKKSLLAMSQN